MNTWSQKVSGNGQDQYKSEAYVILNATPGKLHNLVYSLQYLNIMEGPRTLGSDIDPFLTFMIGSSNGMEMAIDTPSDFT